MIWKVNRITTYHKRKWQTKLHCQYGLNIHSEGNIDLDVIFNYISELLFPYFTSYKKICIELVSSCSNVNPISFVLSKKIKLLYLRVFD
jgi:hypothetical protein